MARIVVLNNSHRYFYLWLTKNLWADVSKNSRYTGTTMSRKALREDIFKLGVISQPPRSPDFNLLDAGIFSYLERRQQEEGAVDLDEIRQSVKVAFDELTDLTVTKVCNAVRANFKVTMIEAPRRQLVR